MLHINVTSHNLLCKGHSIMDCVSQNEFHGRYECLLDLTGGTYINVLGKGRGMIFHIGFFLGSMRLYLVLPEII